MNINIKKEKENYHTKDIVQVIQSFSSSESGLSKEDVLRRLEIYGGNTLPDQKRTTWFSLFIRQFKSSLIYILLFASAVVFFLGEYIDTGVILVVLFTNALIGMIQEGRAERTLDALKRFVKTSAFVIREGLELVISDADVVPGDIIVLKEGDRIPADARIIFSQSLKTDESSLTGESEPIIKISEKMLEENIQISDMKNMLFKGTFVVSGHARAIVVATGINTFIGKISEKLSSFDTEMPLKADIKLLSRFISITVGIASIILFFVGILYGNSLKDMFFTAVAIAVSVVPEGLPIVITLVLAAGVFRMAQKNALVKRLQAVEALGQADVIAVDKTGTITKNELMIEAFFVSGQEYKVTGNGYENQGEIIFDNKKIDIVNHPDILLMGKIAIFCASARASFATEEGVWKVSGDPTEAALSVFGKKVGFDKDELEREEPQIFDIPFDSRIKYHATVHSIGKNRFLTVVGAPEEIIKLSSSVWINGKSKKITEKEKRSFEGIVHNFSSQGLRVLACAIQKRSPKIISSDNLPQLTIVGLYAMRDVLRKDVFESVAIARESGVRVVMITGDHQVTAEAIGRRAGIFREKDSVLTGAEIDSMSDTELSKKLATVSIFARVAPEHKLRIVEAYRARGDVIAMTGDGVNDALSLVAADLGVAMGKIGTEVTKEAADIVLLDDNFKSIVFAIEEGRSIYSTIRKVLVYLFSTGLGEFLTIACAVILVLPLPLLPTQILWLNLVTDGFLVVSFAAEPRDAISKNLDRHRALIDRTMLIRIFLMGLVMTIGSIILFAELQASDVVLANTVVLTALAVFQWLNIFNCRSDTESIFVSNPFKNKFLNVAMILVILLHLSIIYTSIGQKIFHTKPLSLIHWGGILLVALSVVLVEEIRKFIYRRKSPYNI